MWIRTLFFATSLLVLAGGAARAADGIGGENEKLMELTGTVVDVLCELTGRCLPACGAGRRQLGLKLADGKLILTPKAAADFAGSQEDLAPLCGRVITVDGILFENPRMPLYMVQGIKTDPAATEFTPAEAFNKVWAARNGKADEWFRADPAVKELIGRNGPLGRIDLKPKP